MAKVKAPLLSFGASGKIADTAVYFPWKGVNAVRQYVIPANPKTKAQRDQRDRLTAAMTEWHSAPYTASDVTAWNRLAGISKAIMAGVNRMIQEHILEAIKGNAWESIRNVVSAGATAVSFNVSVTKLSGGNAPTVRYGVSKTALLSTKVMADETGDKWFATLDSLTAATLYYFTIDVGTSGTDFGRVGIYQQRTLSA